MAGLDFDRVHDEYRARVRAYAVKLIGAADADDVVQDVFVKVRAAIHTIADPARLTSWIHAVTLNTVRDRARARSRRPFLTSSAGADDALAEAPDRTSRTPEELVARAEMVACYIDYVNQLPRDSFAVYVLAELDDLSNAEIATRLSLPLTTVKIRLHRARARVQQELQRHCRCYRTARGELMAEPKPK